MKNYILLILTTWTFLFLTACGGSPDVGTTVTAETVRAASTEELLEEIRTNRNVPAVAGLIWQDGNVVEVGVSGLRVSTGTQHVTELDKWHLGSITKSMTATLAAKLVENGVINWNTRVDEIFKVFEIGVEQRLHEVTLIQLLAHHGGMTDNIAQMPSWDTYFSNTQEITDSRLAMAEDILAFSSGNPGQFAYSNAGFVVAGAMLEHVTQQSWESLMIQYLFDDLEIYDAGFGVPDDGFEESQPQGHSWQDGEWQSFDSDARYADNPRAFGPAGTVHMSIGSLLKYVEMHLNGQIGTSEFLSVESFKTLHSIQGADYALGWFVSGDDYSHTGSNTRWFANVGWNAAQSVIVIALTNAGGDRGNAATDDIINSFLARMQPK